MTISQPCGIISLSNEREVIIMVKKIEKKIEINLDDLANELDGTVYDYISDNVCTGDYLEDEVDYFIQQINYEDWCYILDKIKEIYH